MKEKLLKIERLRKSFGGIEAVYDVSIDFLKNQLRAVIGPNGAGKTTLFNLVTGAFPPTSGSIEFKGDDITGLSPPEIFRRGIVRTFQISRVFPSLTVLKNVSIAAQGRHRTSNSPWGRLTLSVKEINKRAIECLERVRLNASSHRIAGQLAYGDKRRLEIAMGLASEPEIFLLDEPTAGMSPEETFETAELLRELGKEITLVIVEHDMNVVMSISERITVLDRGLVVADGKPEEIQRDERVIEVYLGTEASENA
jgi:branched-chain amino acid transport system ATP-binding protein